MYDNKCVYFIYAHDIYIYIIFIFPREYYIITSIHIYIYVCIYIYTIYIFICIYIEVAIKYSGGNVDKCFVARIIILYKENCHH